MKSKTCFLLLFANLYFYSNAQTYWIQKTPFWDFLYHSKRPVSVISNTNDEKFLPLNLDFSTHIREKVIKGSNGLFILIDGTEQVYKATDISATQIAFTRIDSTIYFGNSFGSIDFIFHDTMFSFGGYGFWRTNGQLRYFKEGSEWNINKINVEHEANNMLFAYLPDESCIYYLQPNKESEIEMDNDHAKSLIKFDLLQRENILLGKVSKKINLAAEDYLQVNSPYLGGTLVYLEGSMYLFRFESNSVYKLNNPKIFNQIFLKSNGTIKNIFESNGRLYFNVLPDTVLHSVTLSINDFIKEPYDLYDVDSNSLSKYFWFFSIAAFIILFITIILVFYKKRLAKNNPTQMEYTKELNGNENDPMQFSEVEKQLIDTIISPAQKGKALSVEEINNLLGTSRKTLEVQKKVRTDVIHRINHKFKIKFDSKDNLIERIRSNDDRRFYKYTISHENSKKLKDIK
jgi:hypothetical protein